MAWTSHMPAVQPESETPPGEPILRADGLIRRFGGVTAVNDVSFDLRQGEILGLIGPNGAGKTTLFNLVTGLDTPDEGGVHFRDRDITGLPSHRIVRLGIARTFQNIHLMGQLSVLDNVKIAYHQHLHYNLLQACLRLPRYFREEREANDCAMTYLALFKLDHLAHERADSLAYGQRRKLEMARALTTRGQVLLLDEPAAGMNPQETHDLMHMIRRINEEFGITILLIEHDMKLVMTICNRLVVLDHGSVIASGSPGEVRNSPQVIEAYLGVARDDAERPQLTPPPGAPSAPAIIDYRAHDGPKNG